MAQSIVERFDSDPIEAGRFESIKLETESSFDYQETTHNLRAVVDVDMSPAYYLSRSWEPPYTHLTPVSFSFQFRVLDADNRSNPGVYVGLMSDKHLADFGDGLAVLLSLVEGNLVARAHIEDKEYDGERAQNIKLSFNTDYLAVAFFDPASRSLRLEMFQGDGFQELVGQSSVAHLPDDINDLDLQVDRIGIQNFGVRNQDETTGSITMEVDDFQIPAQVLRTISVANASVSEGDSGSKTMNFAIKQTPASSLPTSIIVSTQSGSALANVDFKSVSNVTVIIPPHTESVDIPIEILGDLLDEPDQSFSLCVTQAPQNVSLASACGTGTIVDNDPAPRLYVQDLSVPESNNRHLLPIDIALDTPSEKTITAEWRAVEINPLETRDGRALDGQDFRAASGTITILPGATRPSQDVMVEVLGDITEENPIEESFRLELFEVQNAVSGDFSATVVIVDDDSLPLISVADISVVEGDEDRDISIPILLNRPAISEVSFNLALNPAGAQFQSDYAWCGIPQSTITIPPGSRQGELCLRILGDRIPEEDETLQISISNISNAGCADCQAIITLENDDAPPTLDVPITVSAQESVGTISVEASLSEPAPIDMIVSFSLQNGTARLGEDFAISNGGSLFHFKKGDRASIAQVSILDDARNEASESFTLTLTPHSSVVMNNSKVTVTILDDDALPSLSLIGPGEFEEGNTGTSSARFQVTLDQPSGRTVSVSYRTVDGTATSVDDYSARTGTITLTAGLTSAIITVPILSDLKYETNENFDLELIRAENAQLPVQNKRVSAKILNDDSPPVLNVSNVITVKEGDSGLKKVNIPLNLNRISGITSTIFWTTEDGSASAVEDYVSSSGTKSLPAGQQPTAISLSIRSDRLDEADEFFTVRITRRDDHISISPDPLLITIRITDDDVSNLSLNPIASIKEGDLGTKSAPFSVSLSKPNSRSVSFYLSPRDGSASMGNFDFVGNKTGPFSIQPGSISYSGSINGLILGDLIPEEDEYFWLDVVNVENADISTPTQRIIIEDDDTPLVGLVESSVEVLEGNNGDSNQLVFKVRLNQASPLPTTIEWRTQNDTALLGSDFNPPSSGQLVIPANSVEGSIIIKTIGDKVIESDERFLLQLTSATSAKIQSNKKEVAGIILNDDLPGLSIADVRVEEGNFGLKQFIFKVSLSDSSTSDNVSFQYHTTDGSALGSGPLADYTTTTGRGTIAKGSTSFNISVPVRGDSTQENDEDFFVHLTNVQGAIVSKSSAKGVIVNDDIPDCRITSVSHMEGDNGELQCFRFTVSIQSPSDLEVKVDYHTLDSSATISDSDYTSASGTLVFPPGTSTQTFCVNAIGDDRPEEDEVFLVNLSNPSNVTIVQAEGRGTILDDDRPVVKWEPTTLSGLEGNPGDDVTFAYKIFLDKPVAYPVSVTVQTVDGTAVGGEDYEKLNNRITLGNTDGGEIVLSTVITVDIIEDLLPEADEYFLIKMSNPDGVKLIPGETEAKGIILNDDLPILVVSDVIMEEGDLGLKLFKFKVNVEGNSTSGNVTFRYHTTDGTAQSNGTQPDYTSVSGEGTIPRGSDSYIISVPVRGDTTPERDEDFFIHLTDAQGAIIKRTPARGVILNDDTPECRITDVTKLEGNDGTLNCFQFTVSVQPPSILEIKLDYHTQDSSAKTSDSDYIATSGTLVFPPGTTSQTFCVHAIGDGNLEDEEIFLVTLSNPTNAKITKALGKGTIQDDDKPNIRFEPINTSKLEGNPEDDVRISFNISLDRPVSFPVSVRAQTFDGTAKAGEDFEGINKLIMLGKTGSGDPVLSTEVEIDVIEDLIPELDETMFVELVSPLNANLPPISRHEGLIRNDDETLIAQKIGIIRESCGLNQSGQGNFAVDPGETVRVNLFIENLGSPVGGFQATLLDSDCIEVESGSAQYPAMLTQETKFKAFEFTVTSGTCGSACPLQLLLELDDSSTKILEFPLILGVNAKGEDVCCQESDLAISSALVSPNPALVDSSITYSVTVMNNGPSAVEDAVLFARLDQAASSLSEISVAPSNLKHSIEGNLVEVQLGYFSPGEHHTIELRGKANEALTIQSYFVVRSDLRPDPKRDNDFKFVQLEVRNPSGVRLPSTFEVPEGDVSHLLNLPVFLTPAHSSSEVTVCFSIQPISATTGEDLTFSQTSSCTTIAKGATSALLNAIKINGDLIDELDEQFLVQIQRVTPALPIVQGSCLVTILNDDIPRMSIENKVVPEPVTQGTWSTHTVTINLDKASNFDKIIPFEVANGTARIGQDFVMLTTSPLIIPSGARTGVIEFQVFNDGLTEPKEFFEIRLNESPDYTLSTSNSRIEITDAPRPPKVTIANKSILEKDDGGFWVDFDLQLSTSFPAEVRFTYETKNDTAIYPSDFTFVKREVVIPAEQTTSTAANPASQIRVWINSDVIGELDETFELILSNPLNCILPTQPVTCEIINDDPCDLLREGHYALRAEDCLPANGAVDPFEVVELEFSVQNVGLCSSSQTTSARILNTPDVFPIGEEQRYGSINPGESRSRAFQLALGGACGESVAVHLELYNQDGVLGRLTYLVRLGKPMTNGQFECCTSSDLKLELTPSTSSIQQGSNAVLNLKVINLGPEDNQDILVLTRLPSLIADWTTNSNGQITLQGDLLSWRIPRLVKDETISLLLTGKANAQGTATITSGISEAELLDLDNDNNISIATIEVTPPSGISVGDIIVDEDVGMARVPVSIFPRPSKDVAFRIETRSGSATENIDFIPTSITTSFTRNQDKVFVEIPIVDDNIGEPTEYFEVMVTPLDNLPNADPVARITILDDDVPCIGIQDSLSINIGELDASEEILAPLTVSLSGTPTRFPVTVNYITLDGSAKKGTDYVHTTGTLQMTKEMLNPDSGRYEATIRVPIVGNTRDEVTESFTVQLSNPVNAVIGDCDQDGDQDNFAEVIITDEQRAVLLAEDASVVEGNQGQTELIFPIMISSPLLNPASVRYRLIGQTATLGKDFIDLSGEILFEPGRTSANLIVPIIADSIFEHDESLQLVLEDPVSISLQSSIFIGTIVNDDPMPKLSISDVSIQEGDATHSVPFHPQLDRKSQYPITIHYSPQSGNALSGEDFKNTSGTFTFESESQTLFPPPGINIVGDCFKESDESFYIGLSLDASSEAILPEVSPKATIIDDDELPTVSFRDSISVLEGDIGLMNIQIPLTIRQKCESPITVEYNIAEGTARYEEDFQGPIRGSFTILANSEFITLNNLIKGDLEVEADETLLVTFSVDPRLATLLTPQVQIEIINDDFDKLTSPPQIRFITPAPFQFFDTGEIDNHLSRAYANVDLLLDAHDPDGGDVTRVELYLDQKHHSSLSPQTTDKSQFFQMLREVRPGSHILEAFAFDDEGEVSLPARILFEVGKPLGEVAIVQNVDDLAVAAMESYLFEMKISPRVFTMAEVTLDKLAPYAAIVWYDSGQLGLDEKTVTVLHQAYTSGKPLYFIGEKLLETGNALSEPARSMWVELVGLELSEGCSTFEGEFNFDRHEDIPGPLNNVYGYVNEFLPAKPLCVTPLTFEFEPYIYAADTPVFGVFPGINSTKRDLIRRASQQFLLAPENDHGAREQTGAVFMNTICWLMNACPNCFQAYLSVAETLESDVELGEITSNHIQTGEWQTMDLLFVNNGECDLYGLLVEMTFPSTFTINTEPEFSQVINWHEDGNKIIWRPGQLGRGTVNGAKSTIMVKAQQPGIHQIDIYSTANFTSPIRDVAHFEVTGLPVQDSSPVDMRIIEVSDGSISIEISGQTGTAFVLESTSELNSDGTAYWAPIPGLTGNIPDGGRSTFTVSTLQAKSLFIRVLAE